jgi:DNA-binding transcriptional regulator YhcF (GntR family)
MRLWFAHSGEVPIYRQLVTQVSLAILCGDLRPGERLPSTRELARRFGLHPNTVSAGYRQLEREGWTESRKGSGIYVRARGEAPKTAEQRIDHHIAGFFRAARELGLPAAAVRARVAQWLEAPEPERFVLIDPDAEVRRILLTEIRGKTRWAVDEATLKQCARAETLAGAVPLCRPSQAWAVRAALPKGVELVTLGIRSPNAWLGPWLPEAKGHLVGVASHCPGFLETARTMLIAAGLDAEALVFRDARRARWRQGLEAVSAILCDRYTESVGLPRGPHAAVYSLLADGACDALNLYANGGGAA